MTRSRQEKPPNWQNIKLRPHIIVIQELQPVSGNLLQILTGQQEIVMLDSNWLIYKRLYSDSPTGKLNLTVREAIEVEPRFGKLSVNWTSKDVFIKTRY